MLIPSSNTSTTTTTKIHHVDGSSGAAGAAAYERVRYLISSSAVVLFTSSDCCMCHVAKQLLRGLGVAPVVVELQPDDDTDRDIIYGALLRFIITLGGTETESSSGGGEIDKFGGFRLPAVFVGGKLLGGIESLMSSHINGSLVPRLKDAGALWL